MHSSTRRPAPIVFSAREQAMVSDLLDKIAECKTQGIIAVGFDTLFAMFASTTALRLHGPRGTNAGWVAREILRTRLIPGCPGIGAFLLSE